MRLPDWLGALLEPAEDPRRAAGEQSVRDPHTLLAQLRSSRAELAQLRAQLEGRAAEMSPSQQARLSLQVRELAEQEQELLAAEHTLSVSLDERRAQVVLAAARQRAVDAELHALG